MVGYVIGNNVSVRGYRGREPTLHPAGEGVHQRRAPRPGCVPAVGTARSSCGWDREREQVHSVRRTVSTAAMKRGFAELAHSMHRQPGVRTAAGRDQGSCRRTTSAAAGPRGRDPRPRSAPCAIRQELASVAAGARVRSPLRRTRSRTASIVNASGLSVSLTSCHSGWRPARPARAAPSRSTRWPGRSGFRVDEDAAPVRFLHSLVGEPGFDRAMASRPRRRSRACP